MQEMQGMMQKGWIACNRATKEDMQSIRQILENLLNLSFCSRRFDDSVI